MEREVIIDEAQAERQRKIRAERWRVFWGRAWGGIKFFLVMTILIFAFLDRAEIQRFVSAALTHMSKNTSLTSKLGQRATNYENQVDEITK
jgi:hypothetical protein